MLHLKWTLTWDSINWQGVINLNEGSSNISFLQDTVILVSLHASSLLHEVSEISTISYYHLWKKIKMRIVLTYVRVTVRKRNQRNHFHLQIINMNHI